MAMARATIAGIIIGEPEKRFTQNNTAVTNFTIQVDQAGKNDQPFAVRVTCWRNLAEFAATSLQKGNEVVVEGRLQVNQHESAGGIVKRIYEIDASNIYLGHLQSIMPVQSEAPQGMGQAGPAAGFQQQAAPTMASPQPVAAGGYAPQSQQPQPQATGNNPTWHGETFPQDTLLTEDDIPF